VLESGAALGYDVSGIGVHPAKRIPKISGSRDGPVAISLMVNVEGHGTYSRLVSEVHLNWIKGPYGRTPGDRNGSGKELSGVTGP
jgi:hypothetical protein